MKNYITELYGADIWEQIEPLARDIREGNIGRRKLAKMIDGLSVRKARNIVEKIRNPEDVPEENESIETHLEVPDEWIYSDRYVYNKTDDKYVIISKVLSQNVVRSGGWMRGLFRSYSNWDGNPATINEICRSYEISPSFFQEIKSIFGLTHDFEPFTPEELQSRDEDDLVTDAIQQKRFNLHQKFEKKKWKETKKAAEAWWGEQQTLYDTLSAYKDSPKVTVRYSPEPKDEEAKDAVLVLSDTHLGIDTRDIEDIPDYWSGRLAEYMQEITWKLKNYFRYRNLHFMFLGDAIESWTGMNHPNTWQNLEKNMYGANALFTFRDIIMELMEDLSVKSARFVTGNHGRGSASHSIDRKGQAELVIYRMIKEGLPDVDIDYSSRIVSLLVENYCILGIHGDKGLWKQDVGYLIKEYGIETAFTLVLGGHIHELRVLLDTVHYRKETCSPLFPGNDYSKDNFASSPVGFKVIQANSKGIPESNNCFI